MSTKKYGRLEKMIFYIARRIIVQKHWDIVKHALGTYKENRL